MLYLVVFGSIDIAVFLKMISVLTISQNSNHFNFLLLKCFGK